MGIDGLPGPSASHKRVESKSGHRFIKTRVKRCAEMRASFALAALASLAGHSVLAVLGADPCHGSSRTEVCPVESMDTSLEQEETCSLYLAPSSIPNAGLGIYTAVNLPYGATVGDDFFIPQGPPQDVSLPRTAALLVLAALRLAQGNRCLLPHL